MNTVNSPVNVDHKKIIQVFIKLFSSYSFKFFLSHTLSNSNVDNG